MHSSVLIIMTKLPVEGFSKTRLVQSIGDSLATQVHLAILQDIKKITQGFAMDRVIFYAPSSLEDKNVSAFKTLKEIYPEDAFFKQHGPDLFENMEVACETMFSEGYKKVLVIGSDIPEFSLKDFIAALSVLERDDLVFAPSSDGGYSLIGMRDLSKEVFDIRVESSSQVLETSCNNLDAHQKSYKFLRTIDDLDTFEDITSFLLKVEKHPQLKDYKVYKLVSELV